MTITIPTLKVMTPSNGTNGDVHAAEAEPTLDALLDAATEAPNDLERRRAVFAHLAALDAFAAGAERERVCTALGIRKGEFGALLKAVSSERRASAMGTSSFVVEDGHFVELRQVGGQPVTLPLTNFVAWIDEDVLLDDGEEQERRLTLRGELDDGTSLPRVTVAARQFTSMQWLLPVWGARAIVLPAALANDRVRAAIQYASGDVPAARVFSHSGWSDIDREHVYLSASGGIGPNGQTAARVELPLGLESYALPAPGGADLAEAVRASMSLLDLAPLEVTAPILAAVYLAPLQPFLPVGFTLWLYGQTGTRKTSLLVEALRHLGPGFAWDRLPASWSDSENRLEERAYLLKDSLLLCDDYAPQSTGRDAQSYTTKASRFLRAVGNRQGRGRLNSDLSARRTYCPRGLVASTGELLPPGSESLLARLLVVELRPGAVDLGRLSESQQRRGALYSHAMAGFVQWIAQRWDKLADDLPRRFADGRSSSVGAPGIVHGRSAETLRACVLALLTLADFAADVGAMTRDDAREKITPWLNALAAAARAQAGFIATETPSAIYLETLRTLLASERVRLEGIGSDAMGGAMGDIIGWRDAAFVYLLPDAAYHAVARFTRESDQRFTLSKDALHRAMADKGLLVRAPGDAHLTVKRSNHRGQVARVLQIPLDRFLDKGDGEE